MHKLEHFTTYDIPYLQQYKYEWLELVVTQSCLPAIWDAVGRYCHIERLVDPMAADPGEKNVYGLQTAKALACQRFLGAAVEAIRTG